MKKRILAALLAWLCSACFRRLPAATTDTTPKDYTQIIHDARAATRTTITI